jgi:hypothetical protein
MTLLAQRQSPHGVRQASACAKHAVSARAGYVAIFG